MPKSYKAGHRGAQPVLRSGRCNPASLVARVESWPIPIAPCNVAACNSISHCATLAPQVSLFARAFVERCTQRPVRLAHRSSNLRRGQVSHIATKAGPPRSFQGSCAARTCGDLGTDGGRPNMIEPKFSPQFEFDKPPSEDSNSDVSEPAPQCAVMDDVGCGQRSILPGEKIILPERRDGLRRRR